MKNDLRYAIRMLRKNPGLTTIIVISLALGIGANSTIFSFVNALLLHPPAGVESPQTLMAVWNRLPDGDYLQHCYPDYAYFREHNRVFSGLLAYSSDPTLVSWSAAGQSELLEGQLVSGNYFSVLDVKPVLGRIFLPEEDQIPGKHPVIVLSSQFWRYRLSSDSSVIGKTLTLNGHHFTVLGVAPAGFRGVHPGMAPDFWVPLMMQHQMIPGEEYLANQTGYWLFVAGRLKPEVTSSQAQADLDVLARQLAQIHPEARKGWGVAVLPATGVAPEFRRFVVPFMTLLMAVVGLVLLIACANAANLLLAQASRRWREMAIRSALGAGRRRLIRQLLTESVLLSLAAGVVGLLFALWTGPLLLTLKPAMLSFISLDLPLDWRVLGFTLLLSVGTGVIFGLAAALKSSRLDVALRLKDEACGRYRKSRLRNLLVIGQVAVCLILLTAAGLCLRSLLNARSVDPGFRIDHRLTVALDLRILGYSERGSQAFYQRLLDRVGALPGVSSVSLANYLPLGFTRQTTGVLIDDVQPPLGEQGFPVGLMTVGPNYFQTMGIPVLRGREFSPRDREETQSVIIINEAMAHRFWSGQNPVGQRVTFAFGGRPGFEVVGVVKTGKYRSLQEDSEPFMYRPFFQSPTPRATLILQSLSDPREVLIGVRNEIRSLDPNLPILRVETLREYMTIARFPTHVSGMLLGAFGGLALVLAAVGIYGVTAYSVSQRTHEIGIRMALGANREDILKLVVGQGVVLTVIGLVFGLSGMLALSRLLSSLLYGVTPTDPMTFVTVSVLLGAVAVLACYIPARRATKVDPMVALRYE